MNFLFITLIRFYRLAISPFLGNTCRFFPSCSHYGEQCFKKFGFFKAFLLTSKRICKCHPYHDGGVDEVPD
jgi:uncharacterized protein